MRHVLCKSVIELIICMRKLKSNGKFNIACYMDHLSKVKPQTNVESVLFSQSLGQCYTQNHQCPRIVKPKYAWLPENQQLPVKGVLFMLKQRFLQCKVQIFAILIINVCLTNTLTCIYSSFYCIYCVFRKNGENRLLGKFTKQLP